MKWNEIFLPHLGESIPPLSACSQRNRLRWASPVQLASLEAHRYFRSNIIIENTFPGGFSNHINTIEESTLQKHRLSSSIQDVWKAICSAQTCTMYNQTSGCRNLHGIAIFPWHDLLSPCQGTRALVKPPAVPQKIAMAWYRRYP